MRNLIIVMVICLFVRYSFSLPTRPLNPHFNKRIKLEQQDLTDRPIVISTFSQSSSVPTSTVSSSSLATSSHFHQSTTDQLVNFLHMQTQCQIPRNPTQRQNCYVELMIRSIFWLKTNSQFYGIVEPVIRECIHSIEHLNQNHLYSILTCSNSLTLSTITSLIDKFGIHESYSNYAEVLIENTFNFPRSIIFDMGRVKEIYNRYGKQTDKKQYVIIAINSVLGWQDPNLVAVSVFINFLGNNKIFHKLFFEKSIEWSIKIQNKIAYDNCIKYFNKYITNEEAIRLTIYYSFKISKFTLFHSVLSLHFKAYPHSKPILVKYMIDCSIVFSNSWWLNGSELDKNHNIVSTAITSSIMHSKFDTVKLYINRFGINESYHHFINEAIEQSIIYSKFDIVKDFIREFGKQEDYFNYIRRATEYSMREQFNVLPKFVEEYGNGMNHLDYMKETFERFGTRETYSIAVQEFIKVMGSLGNYNDYIEILENMKQTNVVTSTIQLIIDFIRSLHH